MRVTVLGAGVVGLTTAVRLLEAGCDVQVVTDAPVEATTSYVAAGIWFPTHAGPPDMVAIWGGRTLDVLTEQAHTRHVSSPAELSGGPGGPVDALVICPGLAARELLGDRSVHPVRGQLVRAKNPGLTLSVRDEFHPDGRAYVHPRTRDCVLGGTLDEDQWDTEPDPATAAAIIARCTQLVPALADAEVIEHLVGLRPGRPRVRLEEGTPDAAGTRAVYNYGHGGSGVTLSWGCAEHVTRILRG